MEVGIPLKPNFFASVIGESKYGSNLLISKSSKNFKKTKNQQKKKVVIPKRRQYWLGKHYPQLYLTQREAECIFYLSRGLTIVATASKLSLSARTVEFYLKKVKEKLKIRKKSQLVQHLHEIGYIEELLKIIDL